MRTHTNGSQATRLTKTQRRALARTRKALLTESGHVYRDLMRMADVSYSMAEKWMNAVRTSVECERAFNLLTAAAQMAAARKSA